MCNPFWQAFWDQNYTIQAVRVLSVLLLTILTVVLFKYTKFHDGMSLFTRTLEQSIFPTIDFLTGTTGGHELTLSLSVGPELPLSRSLCWP
jgi:hypothetical protein